MNNWQAIWEKKTEDKTVTTVLSRLLALDGYDTLGAIRTEAWINYVQQIANRLQLRPQESIFDVGCGAGAFLWPLREAGHAVGGLDYSARQIAHALHFMPDVTDFVAGEARSLAREPVYDCVVACGTFLYFPDLDYAKEVLLRMVAKARKAVAILDVPDLAQKEESLRQRRLALGEEVYQERYAGLDHLYYARDWFVQAFAECGLACVVENQILSGYNHSPHRFNVFAFKPGAISASLSRSK